MIYLLLGLAVLGFLISAIMYRLWKSYYGLDGRPLLEGEDQEKRFIKLCESLGALEGRTHSRDLFQGEVLWSEGEQECYTWLLEAGRHGDMTYMRWLVSFKASLGQGMSVVKGGKAKALMEQGGGARQTMVTQVVFEEHELPAHMLYRARDEERARDFAQGSRLRKLRSLESRVDSFFMDDRKLYMHCEVFPTLDVMEQLVLDARVFVDNLIAWSQSKGAIPALETGQYQGALAELEQASVRDTRALEDDTTKEESTEEEAAIEAAKEEAKAEEEEQNKDSST